MLGPCGKTHKAFFKHEGVNILAVRLDYDSVRCYHWRKLGEG